MPFASSADLLYVTVNESLIRKALLQCGPSDLDGVLTLIEAYRTCATAARSLRRSPGLAGHRSHALASAVRCEEGLTSFVATGRLPEVEYPESTHSGAPLRLSIHWEN